MKNKIEYKKILLNNGLTLVNISGLSTNSVTLSSYIRAGCRFDPKDRPGLSHFVEHMTFSGTKSFPNPRKVAQAIEKHGGWHDAFTWIEHQRHTIHLPDFEFEVGIKLINETLFNPLTKTREIEKEKGVINEEILTNKADPSRAVWDYVWFPLFFQGTTLARPYSGTEQDVKKITDSDIKLFMSRYFLPSRTVLLVAGDLKLNYILEKLNKYIASRSNNLIIDKQENPIVPNIKKNILILKDDSYYQTSLSIGIKTVPFNSPSKYTFDILGAMLVGYFGSPLIQKLREKGGLIYSWNSFHDNLSAIGYLIINFSVAHKNVQKVVSIITNEFKRFAQGKFSKNEIEMAKNHLKGKILVNTETGRDYIEWYGLQELLSPDNVISPEEKIEIYKNIDVDEIKQTAKEYFVEKNIFIGAIGKINDSTLKR